MTGEVSPHSVERRPMDPGARLVAALDDLGAGDGTLTAIRRLRYKVYCLEQKFVAMDDCPDAVEADTTPTPPTSPAGIPPGASWPRSATVPYSAMGFPLGAQTACSRSSARSAVPDRGDLAADRGQGPPAKTLRDPGSCRAPWGCAGRACTPVRVLRGGHGARPLALLRSHGIFWTPVGDPMDYYGEVVRAGATSGAARGYEPHARAWDPARRSATCACPRGLKTGRPLGDLRSRPPAGVRWACRKMLSLDRTSLREITASRRSRSFPSIRVRPRQDRCRQNDGAARPGPQASRSLAGLNNDRGASRSLGTALATAARRQDLGERHPSSSEEIPMEIRGRE